MNKQHYKETLGLNVFENYERYFVPAIGMPLAEDLIRHAALHPGERVLDAACGTGVVARLAAELVGSGGTVSGLDVNPGMLAVARSVSSPGSSIEWHEANIEDMPLQDESFDVVICQLGFQFVEDKPGALQEMHRVLVPGGRLILNVPGPAGDIFTILSGAMERNIGSEAADFVNHVFSLHDVTEIQDLLNRAGYRNTDIQAFNKTLTLPAPKEFLWQYVYGTPLAGVVSEANEEALGSLEREVVEKWDGFEKDGTMTYQQRIVIVNALK